jgi:type IV pilus assembly protein PilM
MVKLNFNFRLPKLGKRLMGRSPIGLDVGSRWVKAVQLRRDGARWHLEAAARFPRLQPDAPVDTREASRIDEVLSRQGFHGHNVVLAAPLDKLKTDLLDLPARTPGVPFEQIMRAELGRIHKCDPGKLEVAHWDVPSASRNSKGTQVLAIACQHADAEAVLDVYESAGLAVVGLDARSVAAARACGPIVAAGSGISALLVIEWSSAAVVVMYKGVVVYERRLKEGGVGRLEETLRTQLKLDAATAEHLLEEVGLSEQPLGRATELVGEARGIMETHLGAITQELRASLAYATHQYPEAGVERLLLVGDGAAVPDLEGYFAKRMGLDVRKASSAELVQSPDHLLSLCTPALTPAVGLAQFEE